MPYVEYRPTDADARAFDSVVRGVSHAQSLMDRGLRNAALLQDVEQRKQRFVQETMLSDQQIQQNRLRLAQMEGQQLATAAKARADVAMADVQTRGALIQSQALETNSLLLAQAGDELPRVLAKLDGAGETHEVESVALEFHGKYGHLEKDPVLGPIYAAAANQVAAKMSARGLAVSRAVQAASAGLMPKIDATNPETLAAIRESGFYATARKDPAFAKAFDDASKTATEHAFKAQEAKAKAQAEMDQIKAKDATKLAKEPKETPQYLVEKAMKIDQSSKDLDDLAKMAEGTVTGPFLGWLGSLNPYNTSAAAFEAKLKQTVPNLARGVFGEVGVLTDADIRNYMATLPNIRAPKERAIKLTEMLRSVLTRSQGNLKSIVEGQGYNPKGLPGLGDAGNPEPKDAGKVKASGSDPQAIADELRRRGVIQ